MCSCLFITITKIQNPGIATRINTQLPLLSALSLPILPVGVLTILTPSLALYLVHVCSVTSLGAIVQDLGINMHTLKMPAKVGMWGSFYPLP